LAYDDEESGKEILDIIVGGDVWTNVYEGVCVYLREEDTAHTYEKNKVEVGE
jgi:hypothetical protein